MIKLFFKRTFAIVIKEFIQLLRDRGTLGMVIGIPILQILLFGFAINTNPQHLSTALISSDNSIFTRSLVQGLQNTNYFNFNYFPSSEAEADYLIATNQVQFVLNIPANFTHDLIRGNRPNVLLEADATDPAATSYALSAANVLVQTVFNRDLQGNSQLNLNCSPINIITHSKYNPEIITHYNIIPGLLGVVLTMTMVMITAIAITRERERGTMEYLLSTPVYPTEVMIGKVLPYIIIGYIQATLILITAFTLFHVPLKGNLLLLMISIFPFIAANLSVGLMMSTIAQNQLQALQSTIFFFLPSILLSGFAFPFGGMPVWAQFIGNLLPNTHFIIIVRGILLKGNGWHEISRDFFDIILFLIVVIMIGIKRFRKTLD